MDQRVSVVEGKKPILLIAPSGADDKNTDLITEMVASQINCCAVINWGWRRSQQLDERNDKADCNNVFHLNGVVHDEFLEPIFRFKNRLCRDNRIVYQFVIQGMSNNDFPPNVDIIAGEGTEHYKSCEDWFRDIFVYLAGIEGIKVFMAKPGTTLAGSYKKHLNQLFVQMYPDSRVQSLQLEIVRGLRETKIDAEVFADFFSKILPNVAKFDKEKAIKTLPKDFKTRIVH